MLRRTLAGLVTGLFLLLSASAALATPLPEGVVYQLPPPLAVAGEVTLPAVPYLEWRDGCTPTAVGTVIAYYDAVGYPDLYSGDPYQMIASHSENGEPRHYEDYALPIETTVLLPDKSELPAGDEHPSDCVADFMHTSWSVDGNDYSATHTGMELPGFRGYWNLSYAEQQVWDESWMPMSWWQFTAAIDAGYPVVADMLGHTALFVGYRETRGYREYAQPKGVSQFWQRWQDGYFRGRIFVVGADTTPPTVSFRCRRNSVFPRASDATSGVKNIWLRSEAWGPEWQCRSCFKRGIGTVFYYAEDWAGNESAVRSVTF